MSARSELLDRMRDKYKIVEGGIEVLVEGSVVTWAFLCGGFVASGFVVFALIDAELYIRAKYPDRTRIGNWPGSGFVAYFKFGPGEK